MNIAIITLDSLRYDVAVRTETPNFSRLFERAGADGWHRVYTHGTNTLTSHISILKQGALPCHNIESEPAIYNRLKQRAFRLDLPWIRKNVPALYMLPDAPNVVRGFEKKGYRTVGIGGVGWFNPAVPTTRFWQEEFFEEFYYDPSFGELDPESFCHQIDLAREVLPRDRGRPLFFFLNIASTHKPYRNGPDTPEAQSAAFQYVDRHIPELLRLLPRPCHYFIMADHGECFGEDDCWEHGFYHPKVMEVPMAHFILDAGV